jgi:hypothetical protein
MRRLEYLITQIRNTTDNKDVNGIPTSEIVGYFNDAQRYITTLIFKNNPYADMFKTQLEVPADSTGVYTIPSDCYSVNAISMVEARFAETSNNKGYSRIKPISESEFSYIFGYITRNDQVLISGQNDVAQLLSIRITYFRQLPSLDVRQAKVLNVTAGVSISLFSAPTDLYQVDDYCSAVDAQGIQQVSNIYFTNTSGFTLVTSNTTGVTNSMYITAGKNSCNRSQLPDVCESYLLDYVRQRIYTRNNYEDANKQMFFTEQQKSEIVSIFSKNKKDDDTIPVVDIGFLNF